MNGRLRAGEQAGPAKNKQIGFDAGHGGGVADMMVLYFSGVGTELLLAFDADAKGGGKPSAGKQAAVRNAVIATVLADENAAPEKLSADVETQARRFGRAVGEKVVAYAKSQGWLLATPEIEAQPHEQVKLPEPTPAQNPKKPMA